ncbi:MAG: hypothetical protein LQ338_006835 [Usnochroma carphineum]|nr:MAG: hypothetical protein LQ338_006835 [Usnochroma carphineum]
MLDLRALFALGLTLSLARANSESECGPLPTVTVTVTPSQVMLPVISAANPTSIVSYSALSSPDAPVAVGTSLGATTTESSTSFLTSTLVVNANSAAVPLPAQSDSAGYYYYTEDNGTTTWLAGKTPTSGAVYVTNTVVVTVQPQPVTRETSTIFAASQTTPSLQDGTSTSTVTLSSTDFYTHYLTEALTLQSASPSVPSTRLPPYIASNGWNATLSGVHRVKGSASAPALAGAASGSNPTSPRSGIVATTASRPFKRHHPRQIGAVVSATINGVVVSWVNSYGGSEPASAPEYSWNPSPAPWTSSVVQPQTRVVQLSSLPQLSSQVASTAFSNLAATTLHPSSPSPTTESLSTALSSEPSSTILSLIKPTPPFSNATHTSSTAPSATASSCGSDTGLFTINFDDLPHFSTVSPVSDIPPIFNPYRKLFFNGGYGYVPPPSDPYAPVSPPQLAVYNYHNDSVSQTSVDAGLELHGEIGAGPRINESAYWIDAYSTWIGCANAGPSECTIDFIGYDRFNAEIATQTLSQPPCPSLTNCKLAQVKFSDQFRDLAGLQILAYVNKTPVTFYMDDLSLGWSNNTCAAQLERSSGE